MEFSKMKTIKIGRQTFLVDTESLALRQKSTPDLVIQREVMYDLGTHYVAMMENSKGEFEEHIIPQFVQLDPDGMRLRYSMNSDDPLPAKDSDFKCKEELLRQRIKEGRLPEIDMGGWVFIIDAARNELRPVTVNDNWRPVKFDELAHNEWGYRVPIDNRTGAIVEDEEIMPRAHLLVVEIPEKEVIDPVGEAQANGLHNRYFIDIYPIRFDLKARVILSPKKKLTQTPREKRSPSNKPNRKRR